MRQVMIFFLAGILLFCPNLLASVIHVPTDQLTIQTGINASANGDTVLVDPGIYLENINFNGKNITVASLFFSSGDTLDIANTIIDGDSAGSVVTLNHQENSTAVLEGFTIRNGNGVNGGGVMADSSSASIKYCFIIANFASSYGGGTYSGNLANLNLFSCRILDNISPAGGATATYEAASTSLNECLIYNNSPGDQCNYCYHQAYLNMSRCSVLRTQGITLLGNSTMHSSVTIDSTILDSISIFLDYNGSVTIKSSKIDSTQIGGWGSIRIWDDTLTHSRISASDISGYIEVKRSRLSESSLYLGNDGYGRIDSSEVSERITAGGYQAQNWDWIIRNSLIYADIIIGEPMSGGTVHLGHSTILGNCFDISGVHTGRLYLDTCIAISNGIPIIRCDSLNQDQVHIHCSDLYGFIQNWFSGTYGILDTVNVFYRNPMFCDSSEHNYHLSAISPCLPESTGCGLLGALGIGCTFPVGYCLYVPGDANSSASFNGLDVTYALNYLKGFGPPPPYSCECTSGHTVFVGADANGSCGFNGSDIVFMVNYLKGMGPAPRPCPDCPPAGFITPPAPGNDPTPTIESIKNSVPKAKSDIKSAS